MKLTRKLFLRTSAWGEGEYCVAPVREKKKLAAPVSKKRKSNSNSKTSYFLKKSINELVLH